MRDDSDRILDIHSFGNFGNSWEGQIERVFHVGDGELLVKSMRLSQAISACLMVGDRRTGTKRARVEVALKPWASDHAVSAPTVSVHDTTKNDISIPPLRPQHSRKALTFRITPLAWSRTKKTDLDVGNTLQL
jgi:hypothetical protein